ncbi:MAG: hypothetical protein H7Z40_15680 [Phycisphaerae bacterium]|nr:hypothetical protein [Gemmatimonadaceae bacterium]
MCICPQQSFAQAKPVTWTATEVWRTDGGESGEPFADLRDYVVLKDGSVWALDFKHQDIRRYSADGKLLSKIARKGRGPGELQNANGMVVAKDGKVWVNDPSNRRFSVYGADGKYLQQFLFPITAYGFRWSAWSNRNSGEIVEAKLNRDSSGWRRFDNQGKVVGALPATMCASGKGSPGMYRAETPGKGSSNGWYPFGTGGGLAPDGNGNAWCASIYATRVALLRIGPKNDTIAMTMLEIPNVAVSNAERNAELASVDSNLARYATNNFDKSKVSSSKSGIASLEVDSDGRLWVQHATVFGKREATFDVFDGKGKHLGRVTLKGKQSPAMPVRARGKLLWIAMVDDDDVPYVVHYRLQ